MPAIAKCYHVNVKMQSPLILFYLVSKETEMKANYIE